MSSGNTGFFDVGYFGISLVCDICALNNFNDNLCEGFVLVLIYASIPRDCHPWFVRTLCKTPLAEHTLLAVKKSSCVFLVLFFSRFGVRYYCFLVDAGNRTP